MPSLNRKIRNFVKGSSLRIFHASQRFGIDVLPRHFYSAIPDIRSLRATRSWRAPLTMAGIAGVDLDSQGRFLEQCCPEPLRSGISISDLVSAGTRENGEIGYGPVEAAVLYCFVATHRPRKIIQVGAGFSTAIILRAAAASGHSVNLTCIDPYPTAYLRGLAGRGAIRLVAEPAQEVAVDTLTDLGEGDMLFIDSTHTVKVGGEVNRLVLEVFPRLRRGCFAHLHDIFFPYDYNSTIFSMPFFPMESTLVQAYLTDNARCAIRMSLSMIHYARGEQIKRLFPEYSPAGRDEGIEMPPSGHLPSALYLQMTDDPRPGPA